MFATDVFLLSFLLPVVVPATGLAPLASTRCGKWRERGRRVRSQSESKGREDQITEEVCVCVDNFRDFDRSLTPLAVAPLRLPPSVSLALLLSSSPTLPSSFVSLEDSSDSSSFPSSVSS